MSHTPTYPRRCCRASAFTLVELLVVVAILGVLISLVLTAVNGAKARTHTVVCLANLRQMALALHAYAESGDGAFPTAIWRPATTSGVGESTQRPASQILCGSAAVAMGALLA